MSISRVKTWIPAEVLFASDQNAEFDNILDNFLTGLSPLTGNLDGGDNQINNVSRFGAGTTTPSAPGHFTDTDARTNTVVRNLRVGGTTTGTPAAGIGTGIVVEAESADENPSDFGAIDFAASDVTAASEDTYCTILLRAAGAALAEAIRFEAGRVLSQQDARTNTVARFTVRATTTGTPAANIGTGLLFDAESADEAPSNFGAVDFVATDVTAASEDTVLDVRVRVAGAALAAIWRFASTTAFRGIFTHANTADRTYTLQDSDDTLVGRATTDTLTNKTLTTPTIGGDAPATPTANVLYRDLVPKVWVWQTMSGGTPGLIDDVNVSSITDNGVGEYTYNFATAMANATYAVAGTASGTTQFIRETSKATGSVRVLLSDGTATADSNLSLMVIGSQ